MPRYAVRCCCQPQKILGYLDLSYTPKRAGPVRVHRKIRLSCVMDGPEPPAVMEDTSEVIELRTICSAVHQELAVYSEERPIEFWRGIRGFTEAA